MRNVKIKNIYMLHVINVVAYKKVYNYNGKEKYNTTVV